MIDSSREQGKLTEELETQIALATTKAVLKDLYLPFRPKRRTTAAIAREKGLEPLADAILADRRSPPEVLATGYISEEVPDAKSMIPMLPFDTNPPCSVRFIVAFTQQAPPYRHASSSASQ